MSIRNFCVAALLYLVLSWAGAQVIVRVDGKSGPWDVAANPTFFYGVPVNGVPDQHNGPAVVVSSPDLPLIPGNTITIQYIDGQPIAGGNGSVVGVGGNGVPGWPPNIPPCVDAPGCYTGQTTVLMQLIGAFSDERGVIVGRPFLVGSGPTDRIIPNDAKQLLLGFNDGWYNDNGSSIRVRISEAYVSITLVDKPNSNVYLITAAPTMPKVVAQANLIGVPEDPTTKPTFKWSGDLTIKKGNGTQVSYASLIRQGQVTNGGALYTLELLNPDDILGGDLKLTVETTVGDQVVKGRTSPGLMIQGINPSRTAIQAKVDSSVALRTFSTLTQTDVADSMKRVGCQESRQRQFNALPDGGAGPALISFDSGVGAFQITSGDPISLTPAHVFNWQSNVDQGVKIFESKAKVAKGYPGSLRTKLQYRTLVSQTINQARCAAALQPIGLNIVPREPIGTYAARCIASLSLIPSAPAPDFSNSNLLGGPNVNQLLEDSVRGYNGWAGPGLYGSPLHEFRPSTNILLTIADTELPNLGSNPMVWERVPAVDRGSSGDPAYVTNVASRSTQCN